MDVFPRRGAHCCAPSGTSKHVTAPSCQPPNACVGDNSNGASVRYVPGARSKPDPFHHDPELRSADTAPPRFGDALVDVGVVAQARLTCGWALVSLNRRGSGVEPQPIARPSHGGSRSTGTRRPSRMMATGGSTSAHSRQSAMEFSAAITDDVRRRAALTQRAAFAPRLCCQPRFDAAPDRVICCEVLEDQIVHGDEHELGGRLAEFVHCASRPLGRGLHQSAEGFISVTYPATPIHSRPPSRCQPRRGGGLGGDVDRRAR